MTTTTAIAVQIQNPMRSQRGDLCSSKDGTAILPDTQKAAF
jgi:hypothetical protein